MTRRRRPNLGDVAIALCLLGGALLFIRGLTVDEEEPDRVGPPPGTAVWAVGDAADGRAPAREVARMIAADPPALFLYLGDVHPRGTLADFRRHYAPLYGRYAGLTAPTPGDLDWRNRRRGYDRYWSRAAGRAPRPSIPAFAGPARRGRPPATYAFDVGGWEVISLNSETPRDPRQLRFLRNRVRSGGTCRIAFWHGPRYSAGPDGDQRATEGFWRLLNGRAVLVLNAHDRNMQRFKDRGITQLVTGAGGARLQPVEDDDRRARFVNDEDQGAVRLALRRGEATWQFIATGGRILDQGIVRCRPAPRGR